MPIPDYETLMLPLLRYVAQGECPVQAAIAAMSDQFGLDAGDRQILLPSGRTPLINSRVHWAATYLGPIRSLIAKSEGCVANYRAGKIGIS